MFRKIELRDVDRSRTRSVPARLYISVFNEPFERVLDVSYNFRFVPWMFRPGTLRPTYMFILVILKYNIHFIDFISTTFTNKIACVFVLQKILEQLALNSCHILQNIYKIQNIFTYKTGK